MAQDSLWQRLFNAVKERMQTIHVNNGYETNIGTKCFAWRDLNRTPFTEAELQENVGAVVVRDPSRKTEQGKVINTHDHTLTIEVLAVRFATASSPPDNYARKMLSDIDKAIGVDRLWTVDGVAMARDTIALEDSIDAVHAGDRLIAVRKTFNIIFRTQRFDPYNQ
jgi:hypothetical protein